MKTYVWEMYKGINLFFCDFTSRTGEHRQTAMDSIFCLVISIKIIEMRL